MFSRNHRSKQPALAGSFATNRSFRTIVALCVGASVGAPSAMANETTTPAAASIEKPAEIPLNPRVYHSNVSIMGTDAISFAVSSPRIPANELEKVLVAPKVLESLNQKHLSDLGSINVTRACRIGPVFLDPGSYRFGLEINADRELNLTLISAIPAGANPAAGTASEPSSQPASRVALSSAATSGAVPVVTIAMLPGDDLEGFAIEVRVGNIRGVTSVDFSAERLVVAMNNTAHNLLNPDDLDARIDRKTATLALGLASRANEMTSGSNALILDTYALALFHAGNHKEAAIAQRRAIQSLQPDMEDDRAAMVTRLRAYQMADGR